MCLHVRVLCVCVRVSVCDRGAGVAGRCEPHGVDSGSLESSILP